MEDTPKVKKLLLVVALVLLPALTLAASLPRLGTGQTSPAEKTNVLYVGETGGRPFSSLKLDAEDLVVSTHPADGSLPDLAAYDVVVLNDANLNGSALASLTSWAAQPGHGVLVLMGPRLSAGTELLRSLGFTDATTFANNSGGITDPEELGPYKGLTIGRVDDATRGHPLASGGIVWNTAPELFFFSLVADVRPGVVSYATMQWNGNFSKTNYPLVAGATVGAARAPNAFLFAGWFQPSLDHADANGHFMAWPYFNYLLFAAVQSAAGRPVPTYGKWEYSPVPHLADQVVLGAFVCVVAVATVVLYVRARRGRREHRDVFVTSDLSALEEAAVKEREIFVEEEDDWEVVGPHRALAGFFQLFFLMMLLLIPQLLVTSIVMPRFLNPYPQASGWYSYTLRFFEAIWLVFDCGFNYALAKFFSQHRIERPEKAYHYVQLFVWWEALSGVVQLALVAFAGAVVFPLTNFSYLSWMFVVHSLIQFPGIFLVFQYFFQGMQRADYQQIAFALQYLVLRMALQVVTVPIFRDVYQGNVQYGAAFGAAIGLLVGQLLGDVLLFLITLKLYRGLKLPVGPVFAADFTGEEFRETIKFGAKMMVGNVWVPAVWLLQVYLVGVFLPNASAEQGYFELAFTIATIPQAITLLMQSSLGALTEAHEYEKGALLNYTSASMFRWGNAWTIFLASVFWAIGREFVVGASGPNWARAGDLIALLMLFDVLGPVSWQMDMEFAAAGKPQYAGLAWIVEQSIRAALLVLLLFATRVMEAVVLAYVVALAVKDALVILLVRRRIHRWDWNIWPALVAPALAGVTNFLLLRGVLFMVWEVVLGPGIVAALALFLVGMFVMEHVYAFFLGLFGGFDDGTLGELDRATSMVAGPVVSHLSRLYYRMAALGAKVSPLHGRFPVEAFGPAYAEAAELTSIKRKIVLE
ncbi:MAG: hypothetical protein Kow0069_09330 [Promethearchaeota archaeon]